MRISLSTPLALSDILLTLGQKAPQKKLTDIITHITTSSSLCQQNDLFIALKGKNFDGADFLKEAKERGAITLSERTLYSDISVKSASEALLSVAKLYKSRLKSLRETIVITGSVGKTTTRELTEHLLCRDFRVHATRDNLNNTVGVPITILSAPADTEILLLEAGMNELGELKMISEAAEPTVAVITNIGRAHIGPLGTRAMIAKAKLEILSGMKRVRLIAPADEPYLNGISGVRTASSYADADYRIKCSEAAKNIYTLIKDGEELCDFENETLGSHIPECLAFACASALEAGLSAESLRSRLVCVPDELSRMRSVSVGGITILDDSYNASPESVRSALMTLNQFHGKRLIALLGDMLELGTYTESIHRECGELCAKLGISYLFTFGVYSEFYAKGALDGGMPQENIIKCTDTLSPDLCAENVMSILRGGDILLVKASHSVNIKRVADIIINKLKGNETHD